MPARVARNLGPVRRSSAQERSEATRVRLLDATIDCLVDYGYAATSTTEIVLRAGLTRGAQVHHFPRKTELIRAAILHLAGRCRQELHREAARLPSSDDRISMVIDLLWSTYRGPLFSAAVELLVAGRTDPELRPFLEELSQEVRTTIDVFCADILGPESGQDESLHEAIEIALRFMDGLALAGILREQGWQARYFEAWKRMARPLFEDAIGGGPKVIDRGRRL